jgi:serine/threonine-protein kinase
MESPESSLVPGYRLDRYELLCPIASGGMASVWLARLRGKRGFEKLFAIKTIKTELISDPHFQEMFLDEARIASRIIHPNVAQILELGEQDDILFIVMEYVDGDSVAKVNRLALKRGSPLPPGISMRIVADTCAGLHAAHQLEDDKGELLGVIHRDVSPQNILLTTAGTAKVIDFGLVKAKNRSAAETQSGVVKGKIRYMAPEQVNGKRLDHRVDVWAAGMCLYELITGHTPYHKEDDLDVVKRLMSEDPLPPFDVAVPPQIERILTRAIAKDPEARFESCAAMRRAIEAAIHELDLPAEDEDVAEFLRTTLPELAAKRAKTISAAIEAAETRASAAPSLAALGPDDIAFDPTEVSQRSPSTDDAVPLTRKRPETIADKPAQDTEDRAQSAESDGHRTVASSGARTLGAATLTEQLEQQRRRNGLGFWLAALAVVGAGAWILWPRSEGGAIAPRATAATVNEPPASHEPSTAPAKTASATPSATQEPPPKTSATSSSIDDLGDAGTETDTTPADAAAPEKESRPPTWARWSSRPAQTSESSSFSDSWDGGLSPGARRAAEIMLAPKPTSTESAQPPLAPLPLPPNDSLQLQQ